MSSSGGPGPIDGGTKLIKEVEVSDDWLSVILKSYNTTIKRQRGRQVGRREEDEETSRSPPLLGATDMISEYLNTRL
jgi:hypothetical protein